MNAACAEVVLLREELNALHESRARDIQLHTEHLARRVAELEAALDAIEARPEDPLRVQKVAHAALHGRGADVGGAIAEHLYGDRGGA